MTRMTGPDCVVMLFVVCCLSHISLSATNPAVVTRSTEPNQIKPEIVDKQGKQCNASGIE